MNFLIMFDTHCFSFRFCIFFPSDLLKMMIYSEFCNTKAQVSLSLKCSTFFNAITSVLSNLKVKIRSGTSYTALSGDLLPLFLH